MKIRTAFIALGALAAVSCPASAQNFSWGTGLKDLSAPDATAPLSVADSNVRWGVGMKEMGVPAPLPVPAPIPVREGFSYYFRADLGYSWSGSASFSEQGNVFGDGFGTTTGGGPATAFTTVPPFTFGSSQFGAVTTEAHDVFIGTFGVGAYFLPRFRGDITIDFRGRQGFDANSTYSYISTGPGTQGATINGILRETLRTRGVVSMVNGYFDILPRGAFSPYVGAGIGFVYYDADRTQYMQETQVTGAAAGQQLVVTTNGKETSWGLAAALMAGVTVSFDHRWAIDIGYRAQYLDEVSVELTPSGQLSKATMGDHWEHQARIGLRANIW